jgi:hypothetical protein
MTGSPEPGGAPAPRRTASEFDTAYRQMQVREYMWVNRDRFTEEALAAAAQAAGYTPEEIAMAARSVAKRRADEAAAKPVRARARRYVLGAYAITFLVFAIAFLRPNTSDALYYQGMGTFALGILGITMLIALVLGLVWIGGRRPSAERAEAALGVMLSVPFVLLVVVAGLCLATTGPYIFAPAA